MASAPTIDEQAYELYAAVGMALTAWSGAEWQLSRLFAQCIAPQSFHPVFSHSVAERGFWAVASFEARLKMADATVREGLWRHEDLLREWATLKNRLGRSNRYRNKLAHGTVVRHNQGQPDGSIAASVYFSPYYWNQDAKAGRMFVPATERASERLSAREIREAAVRFNTLKEDLHQLALSILKKEQPSADPASFP